MTASTCFPRTVLVTGIIGSIISITLIVVWFGLVGGVLGGLGVLCSTAAIILGACNSRDTTQRKASAMVYNSMVEPLDEDQNRTMEGANVNKSEMSGMSSPYEEY